MGGLPTSKYIKPLCNDRNLGINPILISAIKRWDYLGIFNVNFCDIEPVVHCYREIGTAVEVILEVRYRSHFDNSTRVKFFTVVVI